MKSIIKFVDGKIPLYTILEKLTPYVIAAFGGSASVLLASISESLKELSPFHYGLVFLIGTYAALVAYHMLLSAKKKSVILKQASIFTRPGEGNPLESRFEKKIIRLTDFFSPFYSPHKNKTFIHCELTGPGNILFLGSTLQNCIFSSCQIAILNKTSEPIINVTAFRNCTLLDCKILGSTIFMTKEEYSALPSKMKERTIVISGAPD